MVDIMIQACKQCNASKPITDFPMRKWRTQRGASREAPRKVCFECQRVLDNARYNAPNSRKRARRIEYNREAKPERDAYRRAYYAKNRDKWLNRETGWRFSPQAKAYDLAYRLKPENMARKSAYDRQWRLDNRPRLLLKTLSRLEKVRLATPPWVTRDMLLPFYEASKRMQQITGVVHHVDHYYPLVSDKVCGLHVPANLRVIPATENLSKANKLPE